jgi:hypothetical protein
MQQVVSTPYLKTSTRPWDLVPRILVLQNYCFTSFTGRTLVNLESHHHAYDEEEIEEVCIQNKFSRML